MTVRLCFASLLVAVLILSLLGCNGDPVGRTVPVKGTVKLDGQPLKQGSLVFWPDAAKGNSLAVEAAAQISAEGTYELITRGKPGAPPGAYKVTVMAQVPINPKDPYSKAKLLVPTEYTTKETTPLQIEVVDNPAPGAYDLPVK